jgi:tetratricopeptide (TPR) repeat protein
MMNVVKKRVSYFTGAVIFVLLSLGVLKLITDFRYRKNLPVLPDFLNISASLKEQISAASRKAHLRPSADNIGTLGMVYHSSAYYDEAAQCYKLAFKKNSNKWIWSYYLGYLEQELGESNAAIENFRAVIKINPTASLAWYYVGSGYQKLGSGDKAEVAFKKIISLQEKNVEVKTNIRNDYFPLRAYAMYQLSRIYMDTDRMDLAENTLKEILKFYRSFGPSYRLLGNLYYMKGDSALNKYYLTRANDLVDFSLPVDSLIDRLALISRSEIYLLKQIDEAEKGIYPDWALELAENGMKNIPDNKYLISKTIRLLLKLDKGKQAIQYLDQHISLFRDDFNEINEVADILAEKGFYGQSLIYYNQAFRLRPESADAQLGVASCLWNIDMKQNALSQVDSLFEKNRNNLKNQTEAIYFLILVGEKEKAVSYLNGIKHIYPDNPGVQKLLGMIAEMEGRTEDATRLYESAFKNDPGDFPTIKYLGNILIRQKLWSQAIGHFSKALEYFPNDPFILERLGTLLVSCPDSTFRNYNKGQEYSERAFIHKGCPSEILLASARSLAEAYAGLGDNISASVFMKIAINLARSENAAPAYIADLENRLKKYDSVK